ncbi:MAG: polyprenol monophosphomannose synthase [Candidatus Sungbacteria bacterium]|uniref:Polyprenol monophosphomannose synthase n=1 Tax=Candidatus Sungiibacteriota bacterium TaxID=2750080 RepID=A0A931SD90_9BACT|nr:polyprenol monophosphomannose synthase [Candidatus Sungbacteria bacterium]
MTKDLIILPTYNERANIGTLIHAIFAVVPHVSILVVDDNSPDGTGALVEALKQKFPCLYLLTRERKEGLGRAYTHAFREIAQHNELETVVTMDADFSHHPDYLPLLLESCRKGYVTTGSRYVPGGKIAGWELWRRILSAGANIYIQIITRLPVHDATSGFNAIPASLLKKIDLTVFDASGYAFLIELKYLLWKQGGLFHEIPITFHNRTGGESKISGHIIHEGILAPWKIIFSR